MCGHLSMENAFESSEESLDTAPQLPFSPHLLKKISELDLSVRTSIQMQRNNIIYIGDLVQLEESQVLAHKQIKRNSLFELRDVLNGFGLRFGMDVPGWPPANIEEPSKPINQLEFGFTKSYEAPIEEKSLTEEGVFVKYTGMGLLKKCELLGLSVRSAKHLHNEGITYIGDLVTKTERELLKIPNFGI